MAQSRSNQSRSLTGIDGVLLGSVVASDANVNGHSPSNTDLELRCFANGSEPPIIETLPPIWTLTAGELDVSEFSPYEDYNVARHHFTGNKELYQCWVDWRRHRCVARMNSSSAPASGFSKFRQLPPELRVKIWTMALPAPRVVRIAYHSGESLHPNHGYMTTSIQNPTLLSVNSEARTLALIHYAKFPGLRNDDSHTPIYFDFTNDILYLPPLLGCKQTDLLNDLFCPKRLKALGLGIKRLAVTLNDLDVMAPVLDIFPDKEELLIVNTSSKDEFEGENHALRLDEINILSPIGMEDSIVVGNQDGFGGNDNLLLGAEVNDDNGMKNDTKPGTKSRGILFSTHATLSDISDQEITFFQSKWAQRVMGSPDKKHPKLTITCLEAENVKTPSGMVRYAAL